MSGHSKWHSIRHKKGAADAKRGKVFSKLAKQMSVAAKEGGGDLEMNFTLRMLVDKAKAANMPKDNIERAIARGTGDSAEDLLQVVVYEGMAPGGASVVVEALTDNTNRTFANVRNYFTKAGGNIEAKVMWQFDHKGVVRGSMEESKPLDDFEMQLIEAGAEDLSVDTDSREFVVTAEKENLKNIERVARDEGAVIESAQLEYVPKTVMALDAEAETKLEQFIETLDDDDDVNNVYTNAA